MEHVGPRADLRALAQGGVLLTARALNTGWPRSSLTARLHAEKWTRVQNGAREWLRLVDRESGSPAETVARLRMLDAGLRPETQVEVRTPSGRRRYLDFLFRAEGLAVEIEGYAYHGTREAHRRDMARFNEIIRRPEVRHVLRFGAAEVFEGAGAMIDEIRASLVWLRAGGGGPPVGSE
ncbi:hypothetical protein ACFUN7_34190 [Streptomyces sp. NPDC057236]|uniref:hypothetical protein n=1 Tax=Streptomyces sp. NPDC057236 TaxID=3346059 RepID=UPI00363BB76E